MVVPLFALPTMNVDFHITRSAGKALGTERAANSCIAALAFIESESCNSRCMANSYGNRRRSYLDGLCWAIQGLTPKRRREERTEHIGMSANAVLSLAGCSCGVDTRIVASRSVLSRMMCSATRSGVAYSLLMSVLQHRSPLRVRM